MNRPPAFFNMKQKLAFYEEERGKQVVIIKDLKERLSGLPEYMLGDKTHIETIQLRLTLNNHRGLREQYRETSRRLKEKLAAIQL